MKRPSTADGDTNQRKKQKQEPLVHYTLENILAALPHLDPHSLTVVANSASDLVRQQTKPLPEDLWRLIFLHTNSRSLDSLAPCSIFYQSLHTLLNLRNVSRSWRKMVSDVFEQMRTIRSSMSLLKKTVYLATIFGNTELLNYSLSCVDDLLLTDTFADIPFHLATCFGNLKSVHQMRNKGFHFPQTNLSIFQLAVDIGDFHLTQLLLAQPSVHPEADNDLALQSACGYGHTEIVKLLLSDGRVAPHARDNNAIALAAQSGHLDVLKLLLTDPRVDVSARDNLTLQLACQMGHYEVVKFLMGLPKVAPESDEDFCITTAAKCGFTEIMKLLLADPRVSPTTRENEPFIVAANCGQAGAVELLLADERVDPDARGGRAFELACEKGHTEVIKLMLKDIRITPTKENLYEIVFRGHLEALKILLNDKRLRNDIATKYILINAVQCKHIELVKFIASLPFIDLSLHNNYALREAIFLEDIECSTFLSELQHIEIESIPSLTKNPFECHVTIKLQKSDQIFDSFGINQPGLTEQQVAEVWAKALGYQSPISYETQTEGLRKHVCFLPNKTSSYDEATASGSSSWSVRKDGDFYPIIFNLVCRLPEFEQ